MTPDPMGGDLTNPQSLNRYAYVMNNPATLTDPLGLAPQCKIDGDCGEPGHYPRGDVGTGGLFPNFFSAEGGMCLMDGISINCGVAWTGLNSGAAAQCPNNVCSGWGTNANGQTAYVQFMATAGGVNGYYSLQDLADGINEYGGKLYNDANYQLLLEQQFSTQISSQCGTVSGNLSADAPSGSGAYVGSCGPLYIQGSHANFPIDCGSWNRGNCAGRWPGGLHIETDELGNYWGHNDTASYYVGPSFNWATFSPWNLVVHGGVDFIGGSLFDYVFPH